MRLFVLAFFVCTVICKCKSHHSATIIDEYLKDADSIELEKADASIYTITDSSSQINVAKNLLFEDNDNIYTARISYYSPREVLSIKGSLLEKNYGCNFFFLPKGELFDFKYRLTDDEYSYQVKLERGTYLENGTPLVDYWAARGYKKIDTMTYAELHFCYFPRKEINVQYSLDGVAYQPFPIKKSKLLPFVMKGKLLNPKKYSVIYFITKVRNPIIHLVGLIPSRKFYDTLRMHE
jgi:hypothetical protein